MAYPDIGEAGGLVERQLDEYLGAIETLLDADALSVKGPMMPGVDDEIRKAVESRTPKRAKLLVLVETTGGYIEPVQRMVDVFRRHYPNHVDFIVPNYAMSAGTVLVMSGDSIYMDYYSVLGPIDPQVESPTGRDLLPGNGLLKHYERLVEKSKSPDGLSDAEMAFFIQRFDPAEMYLIEQSKNLSVTLLKEWLAKYKFKNWIKTETTGRTVTKEMREKRATEIADELNNTDRWHSHGRGISMDVATRDLKLKIDDFGANPELNSKVQAYYSLLVDYASKMGHTGLIHTKGRYIPIMMGV